MMLMYQNSEDIVSASVTKSRPAQKVGLGLEEQNGEIYVTEIGGLFEEHKLPVGVGDRLLTVNAIPVDDVDKFPNGVKDIRRFLKGEWDIRVTVWKVDDETDDIPVAKLQPSQLGNPKPAEDKVDNDNDAESGNGGASPATKNATKKTSELHKPAGNSSRHNRNNKDQLSSSIHNRDETTDPNQRQKRRKKKETKKNSSLHKEAGDSSHNNSHGKKKALDDEADSNHSRSNSKKKKKKKNKSLETTEKRKKGSSHRRLMDDGESDHHKSNSCHNKKNHSVEETENTDSCHSRSKSKKKKERIEETNSAPLADKTDSAHNRTNRKNEDKSKAEEDDSKKIKGVQCDSTGVVLEMNDGNRVSVDPAMLMALFSEEDGKFVTTSSRSLVPPKTKSNRDNIIKPRSRRFISESKNRLVIPEGDEDEEEDEENSCPEDMHVPNTLLQDLRKRSEKTPSERKLSDLRTILQNNTSDDDISLENVLKDSWALMSVSSTSPKNSSRNLLSLPNSTGATNILSLRSLLGDRLKKTNPKKWEESSMVSSTMACMTNLIDPGDVMKIRNSIARPKMNGATVEIVRRSDGCPLGQRWDVRVLKLKNPSPGDAPPDPNQILSVAADNLKHFV